jgi:nicotinate-nucleotide pyrophosphorylase (carboxylating)
MTQSLYQTVAAALAEDIGHGDVTTRALVAPGDRCVATLLAKQDGVLSGMAAYRSAFDQLGAEIRDWTALSDGDRFAQGDVVARFSGLTQPVLTAERSALNFVQRLSGVATLAAQYTAALDGLTCRVCDTRKTTPLLRHLEKEAVRHGGAANHRYHLADGILIKENHIAAAGGIRVAVERARTQAHHLMRIEIEVTNLEQLREALDAGADVIMLDNMDNATMAEAVRINRSHGGAPALLEASGNVSLERIRAMAETGVDFISVGAMTHSAPAIDLSLLIKPL